MINYLIYKLGAFLSLNLPLRCTYKIAIALSDIHYMFSKQDRINITLNLKTIFPEKSDAEIKTIRQQVFRNFAKYLVDFFRTPLLSKDGMSEVISFKNFNYVEDALAKGKGAILVTAHLGNWELGGIAIALLGYKIGAVVLPHIRKRVDNFFNSHRQKKGMIVLPLGRAARSCISLLKENKLIALVGDRDFNSTGILTDFFGKPTYLPRGPVVFSLKTAAPIIPVFVIRKSDDTYTFFFEKPIIPRSGGSKEDDLRQLLSEYKLILEDYIRRYPEQWLMFRKFWQEGQ